MEECLEVTDDLRDEIARLRAYAWKARRRPRVEEVVEYGTEDSAHPRPVRVNGWTLEFAAPSSMSIENVVLSRAIQNHTPDSLVSDEIGANEKV